MKSDLFRFFYNSFFFSYDEYVNVFTYLSFTYLSLQQVTGPRKSLCVHPCHLIKNYFNSDAPKNARDISLWHSTLNFEVSSISLRLGLTVFHTLVDLYTVDLSNFAVLCC